MRCEHRPTRYPNIAAAAVALIVFACDLHGQPGVGRRPDVHESALPAATPEQIHVWTAALDTGSASEAVRLESARSLVSHASESLVVAAIDASLSFPLAGAGGGRYILTVIEETASPPSMLVPVLESRSARAEESELPRLIRALGFFRTRDAARAILHFTDHHSATVREAAIEGLGSLSGERAAGRSAQAWSDWLAAADALDELGWSKLLVDSISRSERAAVAREGVVRVRLLETLRKLHLETPTDRRSELLASMLRDNDADVRRVGFELARRELSVNGSLDGSVGQAAIELLRNPDASVRADAAVLVRQLGALEGDEAVLAALLIESDAAAAANLLVASARWPRPEATPSVMRWLANPATRPEAAEAAWALVRTASIDDAARAEILDLVLRSEGMGLSAPEIQLIGALGGPADLQRLVPLLDSASGTVQRAAADALVWDPATFNTVIEAAARHPNLFDAATTAILVHNPTIDGFRRAASLPVASEDLRRERLAGLSRGMGATEVLAASEMLGDPQLRSLLLAAMTTDARIASERDRPEALAAISEAIVRLTEDDVAARRHDAGLGRFELFPFVFDSAAGARAASLRCCCLIALGRLTAAVDLSCDLASWWRGLEGAAGRTHELAIVEMIESDFGEQLDGAQRELLRNTRVRLAEAARPK